MDRRDLEPGHGLLGRLARCTNCYAMKLAGGRLQHHPSRAGLTSPGKAGPVWNGTVRLNEDWLDQPLRWRRPRRIFVCAHGDLFHESVPDDWIDRVFAVMALAPHHQFQVLTKRAARMRDYMTGPGRALAARLNREIGRLRVGARWPGPAGLRHIWLGVSAEDQARADERIPALLETPAAVRFLSAEPLLGAVDLTRCGRNELGLRGDTLRWPAMSGPSRSFGPRLDWVIVGGESGPGARPMHPDWARSLRDQCQAAGVPFFFKQWGAWKDGSDFAGDAKAVLPDGRVVAPTAEAMRAANREADARGGAMMRCVGKARAGRELDGRTWEQMPGAGA